MGPLLSRAVDRAPANRGRFKDMGLGLIAADQDINAGKLGDQIKKIFLDRKIISDSDLQNQAQRQSALPDLRVDHNFTSAEEVAAYTSARGQQLGLPEGVKLETVSLSLNERGEQVANLLYQQTVPVTVPGLEGLTTDVNGGVTLAFDAQGKLSDFRHTGITPEFVQDEMNGLAYMQRRGQILEEQRGPMIYTREDGKPYLAVIRGDKLVRVPSSACECGSCGHCQSR